MRTVAMQANDGGNNLVEVLANGDSEKSSTTSRFASLLVSKDRDYLLSPTGAQVFPFFSLSLGGIYLASSG